MKQVLWTDGIFIKDITPSLIDLKVTHGWIEIRDETNWWYPAIRVNALVPQLPDITSMLFGVDDHLLHRKQKPQKPIADHRGLPNDLSEEVMDDYYKEQQSAHFETYIYPDEIARVLEVKVLKKGWPIVFAFFGVLAEMYGDKNVRLVVWFI